jgi:aminopeptidase N
VTIEDFLACFADATGKDLSRFRPWYSQAGTPEVRAHGEYDGSAKTYTLRLSQATPPTPGQPVKQALHIPIRFGLVGPNGGDLHYERTSGATVTGDVIHLTEPSQTITFHGVSARPVPSLLRGFSAPVRLDIDLGEGDLLFLLRTDADPFNRWQAGQTLAMRTLTRAAADIAAGRAPESPGAVAEALGEVAGDEALEPAFRAQVLTLPSEADIAREIGKDVDSDAIFAARKALRSVIADRIRDPLSRLAAAHAAPGRFSPDAEAAGRRALANAAFDLLLAGREREPEIVGKVVERFEKADNMTDRLAALSSLSHAALPERVPALAAFRERYRDDPLVLDKWLMLEAGVPAPETLDRVKALLADPAFPASNPNRIRALVGGFANGNQTQFNRRDGAGYDFLAGFVGDLDGRNPQTAARLLVSFRSWRSLEAGRRTLAEKALRRLAERPDLSPDTRDIATRTLA